MEKAGFLLSEDDVKNLAVTEKIVLNHFGLDADSRRYFSEQVKNPDLPEVYLNAFKKFGSSRIVIDIPDSVEEKMDYSWSNIFKKKMHAFINKYGFTYSDYKNNRIEIDKNVYKTPKALNKFYREEVFNFAESTVKEMQHVFDKKGYVQNVMSKALYDSSISFLNVSSVMRNLRDLILLKDMFINEEYDSLHESKEDVVNAINAYTSNIEREVEETINYVWRDCSNSKFTKSNNLKVVISFNYADWFLCSTGESWGSCLNLNGSSANYWYGLPGLIGDKNRVMIYITNGEKKNCYGIQTDKFLYRTWALLDNEERLNIVRWFPREDIGNDSLYDLIQEKTGWKINRYKTLADNGDFTSLHELNLIYSNDNISLFPYLDYADFTSGEETYIISGESGMLHKKKGGNGNVYLDEYYSYDDFCSLGDLMDNDTNICDARKIHSKYCEYCSRTIQYEDYEYYTPDGEIICERCFDNNYFHCQHCGEVEHNENGIYVDGVGMVCNDACFHDHYFMCELTDEICDLKDAVQCCDDRNGRATFLASYQAAESNGYILNEEDDTYYKPEFMVLLKDGGYVHIDDYENQLELEFEEAV